MAALINGHEIKWNITHVLRVNLHHKRRKNLNLWSLVAGFSGRLRKFITNGIRAIGSNTKAYGLTHLCRVSLMDFNYKISIRKINEIHKDEN